ncbi:MAG TPA: HAMP domain-containing sensor histidine kinase, partial [Puia sp.]|nr:HAMP domain-containing sensor histidine kinase [Puia sp.]
MLSNASAQEPDLSKLPNDNDKIKAWIDYCESLRLNSSGIKNNYAVLQQAALKGITLTTVNDEVSRSRFLFYAAFGCYYQTKFDSAQFYFYESLHAAQKANSAELISNACVALIPVNFQFRQQDKVDSCKNILQSILDTTHNKKILQDGYSAMGSYYQQKSYYSTAQDYFLKSIELRKKQLDTAHDKKLQADYAIQCYLLSKQYANSDALYNKSLAILQEGKPFANVSPPVYLRYLSSFTEIYALLGNIDSALHYELLLEDRTKNNPVVSSEMVSANLNIAKYYLDRNQFSRAFPYVSKADTLAKQSKSLLLIYQAQIWMGKYLDEDGKSKEAISLFTQALPVAKQISKEQYVEALKFMATAQKNAGNANEAIQYYEQYAAQTDTLTKEKISRNFADQETRYETNQKEQRIVTLNKENQLNILELQNATRTKLLLVLGLAALGVISLLLYFIYRNKEKVNKILNSQNNQLEILNTQLAVANETKAKLFGIIGHDLRSPVSQIVQLLQLQKENPQLLNEQSRLQHEARLKTASENVLETMEDLLLWSKSQMQHFTPQFVPVKISETVEKELNLLHQRIEDKNLKISNELNENFVKKTDENFLSIIIRNLLQNAIKYSDEGSIISISADEQNIFIANKSFRADSDLLNALLQKKKVDSKVSGLGLQIASDLAASINAKISFSRKNDDIITATI